LVEDITSQLATARASAALWIKRGVPVALPGLYHKKDPRAAHSIGWHWLFPASGTCHHPRTGEIVLWHMHPANVQRAVHEACRQAGLSSRITPHSLRHAWATHSLSCGANIRAIQETMGHASLETTMVYLSLANPPAMPDLLNTAA
jgi:integrase